MAVAFRHNIVGHLLVQLGYRFDLPPTIHVKFSPRVSGGVVVRVVCTCTLYLPPPTPPAELNSVAGRLWSFERGGHERQRSGFEETTKDTWIYYRCRGGLHAYPAEVYEYGIYRMYECILVDLSFRLRDCCCSSVVTPCSGRHTYKP